MGYRQSLLPAAERLASAFQHQPRARPLSSHSLGRAEVPHAVHEDRHRRNREHDQIEYEDEDPIVYDIFKAELARRGLEPDMAAFFPDRKL